MKFIEAHFGKKEKAQWQEEAQQYNKGWRKKN